MAKVAVAGGVVVGSYIAVKALTSSPATVAKFPPTYNQGKDKLSVYPAGKSGGFTDHTKEAPIYFAKEGAASEAGCAARTIPEVLEVAAMKKGNTPALRVEENLPAFEKGNVPQSKPLKQWKTWTMTEYRNDVVEVAKAFMALGMKRFDAVSIFGFNSPEWLIAELAAIQGGGIAAGIYPTDTPDQVFFKARHSGSAIAAVDDLKKAKMFLDRAGELPKLKAVVVWGPAAFEDYEEKGVKVVYWKSLAKLAQGIPASELETRVADIRPGHVCAYIYTSGTTGNPKAVMITHDNILYESCTVNNYALRKEMHAVEGVEERLLSYLPLSHVAGMMMDIVVPLTIAADTNSWVSVNFARIYDLKVGTIGDRLRAVRPTIFLGVPRVWEKVAEKMKSMVAANPLTGIKLKLAKWAKSVGLAHQMSCQLGGNGEKALGYGIAKAKVLDMVKLKLGLDACKFAMTGAAPITIETLSYFGALGIQINEAYGMSECTGGTTWSTDEAHVWGSCGWALHGQEVAILNDKFEPVPRASSLNNPAEKCQGEICYRGRHIMAGYMANPDLGAEHVAEITKKVNDAINVDGWLRSGDKGCMDERGMVKITGRYKELIITAGGENIAPVPIEDNIKKLHAGISNVMMVGDKRKFNVALVTLKAKGATGVSPGGNELDGDALTIKPGVTTISGACQDQDWTDSIKQAIIDTNNDGNVCPSNASKIQKFTILPLDFSCETEEFTPTYKLKRSFVDKKYINAIEAIYAPGKDLYVPFKA